MIKEITVGGMAGENPLFFISFLYRRLLEKALLGCDLLHFTKE